MPSFVDKAYTLDQSLKATNVSMLLFHKVFNVGDYRRQAIGDYQGHDFFHPRNRDGNNVRNKCALDALQVSQAENTSLGW